jgi:hypothetical protein
VAEQQRLIELLKEKRQAVISHAVTKGLNPNAPMKDSGIEWLGEVPAHWACNAFAAFPAAEAATQVGKSSPLSLRGYPKKDSARCPWHRAIEDISAYRIVPEDLVVNAASRPGDNP